MGSRSALPPEEEDYARRLDAQDPLAHLRDEFIIPSKAELRRPTLQAPSEIAPVEDLDGSQAASEQEPCIYLCGNSLGLQPRRTRELVSSCLRAWSVKAVYGHFTAHTDSSLPPFVHYDDYAARLMAPLVGAREDEVSVMGTLTANLHLLMASFYRPTASRYKVMLEAKAFPSDHYAVESAISLAGFDPKEAMVLVEPSDTAAVLTTEEVLRTIDHHADRIALVLLPAVQFYTGQHLDMATITRHGQAKGSLVGWDCAHAAGNVELQLHEWGVDFAVWCNYKYLNSGPGAVAALFVHERHGRVDLAAPTAEQRYRPRLCGWWGADKETRFDMDQDFVPRPGAAGYQLSNPSILDLTALIASLEVFHMTTMAELRQKSISLTGCLERFLTAFSSGFPATKTPFVILTPAHCAQRGAQLSIKLTPGLLDPVLKDLDGQGIVVDERKPDVLRVAPAPLYNSFHDVWQFARIFSESCRRHASCEA